MDQGSTYSWKIQLTTKSKKWNDITLTDKCATSRKIEQQEVLERVIKTIYEIISKNFVETNVTLEILAHESIKEKKKKKKIVKDYISLWRVSMHLKKKFGSLRLQARSSRPQPQTPTNIETLANAAIHMNDPEATNNPTTIPEIDQDAEAYVHQP